MDDNLRTYNSPPVIKWYNELDIILPVENYIFEQYKNAITNGQVLDIGIGAGRTTAYLSHKCAHYTGIDYSEEFIKLAKVKFPGNDVLKLDARDLSVFEQQQFDFINFSFNGLDYVNKDDRVKALAEIFRVLKPGGVFFFSTHNLSHSSFNRHPWLGRHNSLWVNIKTLVKLLPFLPKKLKNKKRETQTNGSFAIINDAAHNYSLFTLYSSPDFLRKQLSEAGFSEITYYNRNGKPVKDDELDDWIFVTSKKAH